MKRRSLGNVSARAAWLCGATIFLSAFLLFLVQPILGKMILPWFGGSAGVWVSCLVFFQTALLAGYAYAYGLTSILSRRRQALVHGLLIAASLLMLPIVPSATWRHPDSGDPTLHILALLGSAVGLPYLLIAATGPLLQAWYVELTPEAPVYRFYSLSNLGSLLGLLSFSPLIERRLASQTQAVGWSSGYALFGLLSLVAAGYTLNHRRRAAIVKQQPRDDVSRTSDVSHRARVAWVALAACSSGLLMTVTNHLSQNVAPIPLLWTLLLAAYLLSFVVCFGGGTYRRGIWMPGMWIGLGAMAFYTYANHGNPDPLQAVAAFGTGLFACCMVCHGELWRLKPTPHRLPSFYLWSAAGGVLGGFFVAIVAPHLFKTNIELPLLLTMCGTIPPATLWQSAVRRGLAASILGRGILVGLPAALAGYLVVNQREADRPFQLQVRSFYGTLRVREGQRSGFPEGETPEEDRARLLFNGTIEHGAQMLDRSWRREPTDYYVRTSGVGLALEFLGRRPSIRVGVVGLGAGVIASYCRQADVYRFYEVNPDVERIARSAFTFLDDCPGRVDVVTGDARLSLERQSSQQFDLIAVDAFSGDAIPVHLLTREAFVKYFWHLRADGVLAVNVSNRYLNLTPVVAGIANALHKKALVIDDDGRLGKAPAASRWILLAEDENIFDDPVFQGDFTYPATLDPAVQAWTDDYSNLLDVLDLAREKR